MKNKKKQMTIFDVALENICKNLPKRKKKNEKKKNIY